MQQSNGQKLGRVQRKKPAQPKRRRSRPSRRAENLETVPAAFGFERRVRAPTQYMRDGVHHVIHTELLYGTLAGATSFTVQQFLRINPGLPMFVFLSDIAKNFEQYRFNRLSFEFMPISATSSKGSVMFSPNFDASDPRPVTERQALNNVYGVSSVSWRRLICDLPSKQLNATANRHYVRTCAVAGDLKTYDVCTMAICTNDQADTDSIGKIFVHYDVELYLPQTDPSPSTTPLYTAQYGLTSTQTVTNAVEATVLLSSVYDPLALAISSGVITPPAGVYRVSAHVCLQDSANEACGLVTAWRFNGANVTASTQRTNQGAAGSASYLTVSTEYVFPCNGTDTIALRVLATGAAGTLTLEYVTVLLTLA